MPSFRHGKDSPMSTQLSLWSDIRRAGAQWTGVALAAVLSGVLLGVQMQLGLSEKRAFEISLAVGFLLAVLFWVLISRRMGVRLIEYSPTASATTILQVQGDEAVYFQTAVAATAVLAITLYSVQARSMVPNTPLTPSAVSFTCYTTVA